MGYIRRNNLKQFPDPFLSPTGYHKVDKERMREFFQINDIGSWAQSDFSRKVRGKHGYWDDPPFHDHYRIYFKRNGDQCRFPCGQAFRAPQIEAVILTECMQKKR